MKNLFRRRFLSLQDPAAPRWVASQTKRLNERCLGYDGAPARAYVTNTIGLSGRVQKVMLSGDLAWAQVLADEEHERHVRFYRWTERGWVQAPPDPVFWGEPAAWQHKGLLVQGTVRDRPYAERLAAQIWDVAQDVCGVLGCTSDLELRVTFLPDAIGHLPQVTAHGLLLPSPWLTGIPADGQIAPAALDPLTYWSAYYAASVAVDSPGLGSRNLTQRAILAEYARFYTEESLETTPILRRIAGRQGIEALPQVLSSLSDLGGLSDLMVRWFSVSTAGMPETSYAILAEIGRDPALYACQETFDLLSQEQAGDTQWVEWMERDRMRDET